MKKCLIPLAFALAILGNLGFAYSQTQFTVIDTISYDGSTVYELGLISLADLKINPKFDNYVDLVKAAEKTGWTICPADPVIQKRIATKVHLEPEKRKFCAFIATAPFTDPNGSGHWHSTRSFLVPVIHSMSQSKPNTVGLEQVGYFDPEHFPEPFPALDKVGTWGYWSITEPTPVMYDWVFTRRQPTTAE